MEPARRTGSGGIAVHANEWRMGEYQEEEKEEEESHGRYRRVKVQ